MAEGSLRVFDFLNSNVVETGDHWAGVMRRICTWHVHPLGLASKRRPRSSTNIRVLLVVLPTGSVREIRNRCLVMPQFRTQNLNKEF